MKTIFIVLPLLLILTVPNHAIPFSLSHLLENNKVVIIGETHRRSESTRLITETVTEYLQKGKCLIVALEISSTQQVNLDRVFCGKASIYSIRLNSLIDHTGYRRMLASFREHIKNGKCLKVRAIDAPAIVSIDRDEWMERQILEMVDGIPILVLVGNFHALKEVKWNSYALSGPSLAERLLGRGLRIASILQYWEKEDCRARSKELFSTLDPGALRYIEQIMKVLNAEPPDKSSQVADGVIVWRCIGNDTG